MGEFQVNVAHVTEIKKTIINHEWTIVNYKLRSKTIGECFSSPIFSSEKDDLKWQLKLYPSGYKGCLNYATLYLCLVEIGPGMKVQAEIEVSMNMGQNLNEKLGTKNHLYRKSDVQEVSKIRKLLFSEPDGDNLSLNEFKIITKIKYNPNNEVPIFEKDKGVSTPQEQISIYNELGLLMENKELTDMTLVSNGEEFHVHKAILAARSSIFLAMFRNDMKEKNESRVEILDFDSDTLSDMLQYVYTGTVKNLDQNSVNLLKISDKYDIKGLRALCEDTLYSKLNFDNVIKVLILADSCSSYLLKKRIIAFMVAHKNDTKKLPEFKALKNSHPQLGFDILQAIW